MTLSSWKIEWSDSLSMSNPRIDAEHQHFIKLVNQLNDEIMSHQPDKAVLGHILSLLLMDALDHFAHEERLFAEKAYPAAQEHAQVHANIISTFKQMLVEIQSTKIRAVWLASGLKIRDMLVDHMMKDDSKYIQYLKVAQESQIAKLMKPKPDFSSR